MAGKLSAISLPDATNVATVLGWRVLRVTHKQVAEDVAIVLLERLLASERSAA